MDKNKKKKIIVNGITISRLLSSFLIPIIFSKFSVAVFLLIVLFNLTSDILDGFLAKHVFHVSTLGGSLLDMTADKMLSFSILGILSSMYPVMAIPLLLEILIASINVFNFNKKAIGKSSQIGRIKTVLMGVSIGLLFLVGLSPELIKSINNTKIINILKFFANNKSIVNISETVALAAETVVASDYLIKSKKKCDSNDKKFEIAQLIKNKEFIKEILFDEKYYEKINNQNMSLVEKLLPNEKYNELKEEKKLVLNRQNFNTNNRSF